MIDSFLMFLKYEKKVAANTLEAYERDLSDWEVFGSGVEVTASLVSEYCREISLKEYQSSTVQRKLSVLRSYLKFLYTEGHISFEPNLVSHKMKTQQKLPKVISNELLESLLKQPLKGDRSYRLRDYSIMELLYSTGLRVSELCSLTRDKFLVSEEFLRITGKGNKDRVIPLGEYAINCVQMYLDVEYGELNKEKSDSLFLNKDGYSLSRKYVFNLVKSCARSIDKDFVSPHTLRHAYATHMLDGGADVRDIQVLLGHSNISTTEMYIHTSMKRLKEVYFNTHPRS